MRLAYGLTDRLHYLETKMSGTASCGYYLTKEQPQRVTEELLKFFDEGTELGDFPA